MKQKNKMVSLGEQDVSACPDGRQKDSFGSRGNKRFLESDGFIWQLGVLRKQNERSLEECDARTIWLLLFLNGRQAGTDMQVALGKGDFNAGLFQLIKYFVIEFAAQPVFADFTQVHPDQQVKVDGAVAVGVKKDFRLAAGVDVGVGPGGLQQDLPDLFGIGVVGDTHRDVGPDQR